MLLGVPIPYASVGKISPELWALCAHTWAESTFSEGGQASNFTPYCHDPSMTNSGDASEKPHHVDDSAGQQCRNGLGELKADVGSGGDGPVDQRCVHRSRSKDLEADGEGPTSDGARLDKWLAGYLRALAVNSAQVQRYLDRYSAAASSPFPAAQLARVRALHQKAIRAGGQVRHRAEFRSLEKGESGRFGKEGAGGRSLAESENGSDAGSCQFREVEEETVFADSERAGGMDGRKEGECGGQADNSETCRTGWTGTDKDAVGRDESVRRGGASEAESRVSALRSAIAAHLEHLTKAAELARAQWTQFDGAAMVLGLTVLAASLLAHLVALLSLSSDTPGRLPWARTVTVAVGVGTAVSTAVFFVVPAIERLRFWVLEWPVGSAAEGGANEFVGDGVNALVSGAGAAALASVAALSRHVLGSHVAGAGGGTGESALSWRGGVGRTRDWGLVLFTCMHAASLISDNCISEFCLALETLLYQSRFIFPEVNTLCVSLSPWSYSFIMDRRYLLAPAFVRRRW